MMRVAQSGHVSNRPLAAAALAAALLLGVGCASAGATPTPRDAAGSAVATSVAEPTRAATDSAPLRHVGDLFVHRFSGSFAAEPLTLTEEVTGREDTAWVVDFSLTQSEKVERLRVRFDSRTGQAISAARLGAGRETPAALSDYDALMARTVYAADVNDGLVSTTGQTCLVGTDEHTCETKTYKVWVGDRPATLAVVHSTRFADRDVSGELTTDDGKLVYRAELIEARPGKPTVGVAAR
jgi:hypothetical protein